MSKDGKGKPFRRENYPLVSVTKPGVARFNAPMDKMLAAYDHFIIGKTHGGEVVIQPVRIPHDIDQETIDVVRVHRPPNGSQSRVHTDALPLGVYSVVTHLGRVYLTLEAGSGTKPLGGAQESGSGAASVKKTDSNRG